MWTLCANREPREPKRIPSCSLDTIILPLPAIVLILALFVRLILHFAFPPPPPREPSPSSHQPLPETPDSTAPPPHAPRGGRSRLIRFQTPSGIGRLNEVYWASSLGRIHSSALQSTLIGTVFTVNVLALLAVLALSIVNIHYRHIANLGMGLLVFIPPALVLALALLRDHLRPYFLFPFYVFSSLFHILDVIKAVRVNDDFLRAAGAGTPPTYPQIIYTTRHRLVNSIVILILYVLLARIEFMVLINMRRAIKEFADADDIRRATAIMWATTPSMENLARNTYANGMTTHTPGPGILRNPIVFPKPRDTTSSGSIQISTQQTGSSRTSIQKSGAEESRQSLV